MENSVTQEESLPSALLGIDSYDYKLRNVEQYKIFIEWNLLQIGLQIPTEI